MPVAVVAPPGAVAHAASRERDPGFSYLDVNRVLCDATLCHPVVGGIPAYVDPSHLSAAFARSLAPELKTLIGAAR
jgi:hypothetical protein